MTEKISKSSDSPVKLVAFCQQPNSMPNNATASTGGNHALPVVSKAKSLRSRVRSISVRSCGNNATQRANKPSAAAPHTAEKIFRAMGMFAGGNQRNG